MTHDGEKTDYAFNILQEQVSPCDLFEDGTHENVAKTLEQLILSSNNAVTIGLEGSWGAGKSTVIHLLENKLDKKPDNTLFFSFDAWAHDGDPLRKIFLESLISKIDPDQTDKNLNELKNRVSSRTKTVSVTTTKSASPLGRIISISALLIPFGAAFISATNLEKLVPFWSSEAANFHWFSFFGALLALSPILVIGFWILFGERFSKKGHKWDFLESESTEDYTQDITEDGERTSIEFERFFSQILSYVLTPQGKYKRAVFVVDNLDRVEPDHAKALWSTLQTFFQHRSTRSSDEYWQKNLWFIVPFDREGMQRIWDPDQIHSDEEKTESKKVRETASSFMEKCFQVIAEVPSPVTSAWIGYLNKCVQKSFIGWPLQAKEAFIDCYVQCMSSLESSPSPRKIHSIINRAGYLAMQWRSAFSTEAICIYSLYRQEETESEFRNTLLTDTIKRFPIDYISNASNIRSELSGLLFGVCPEKGMQLLLTPEIKRAITEGAGTLLKDLADTHKEAFWVVWRAKSSEWRISPSHVEEYRLNMTKAFYEAFITDNERGRIQHEINLLEQAYHETFDKWISSNQSHKQAITQLLELTDYGIEILNWLHNAVTNHFELLIDSVEAENFSHNALFNLKELSGLLQSSGRDFAAASYERLSLPAWIKWLDASHKAEVKLDHIRPAQGVIGAIADHVGFGNPAIDEDWFAYLQDTNNIFPDSNEWITVANKIMNWFNLAERSQSCESVYSFVLKIRARLPQTTVKIDKCVAGQAFWQGSGKALKNAPSISVLAAVCIPDLQLNAYVSDEVKQYWQITSSEKEIQTLVDRLRNINALDKLWLLVRDKSNALAIQILRENIDEPEIYDSVNSVKYLDELEWASEEELAKFTSNACKYGAAKLLLDEISKNTLAYDRVIKLLIAHGDPQIKAALEDVIAKQSKENWKECIKDNYELLSYIPNKSVQFTEALDEILRAVVVGELTLCSDSLSQIPKIAEKMMDGKSMRLPALAKAYFEATEDSLDDEHFHAVASLIAPVMKEVSQSDYEKRLWAWLDSGQNRKIEWLLSTPLNKQMSPSETLKEKVKQRLTGSEENDNSL